MTRATAGGAGAGKPEPPTLTHVRYDGAALSVAWTGNPNAGTRYEVDVFDGDTRIASADAGPSMTAVVPIELAPGGTYGVTIVASTGGWSSLLVEIVTATVAVSHAATDPATGALTLAMPAGESYRLRLSVNGAPPGPEQSVDGAEAPVTPPPPGSVAAATLALATVGEGGATSIGPYGAAFALPTQRPELLGAAYDGTTLHVAWTGATGADAYVVTVLDAGAVSFQARVAAPATEAYVTPGITGTTGTYAVVVQAATGASTGPPSAPLPLLLAAATVGAVTYDGALLSVTATPPAGPAPSAYDLALLRDGAPVRAVTVGATVPLALAADASPAAAAYAVVVRPRAGLSVGPPVAAPAVLGTPDVAAAVCTTDIAVTPAAGRLAAGVAIDAVLYSDGEAGTPVRVDGTATFAIPPGAAAVSVRGADGVATGPWSPPVAVPTLAPVVTAARSGRDAVELAWRGAAGATFRVTAGDVETVVRGLSATLAAPGATAASVTEIAGVSTGPTATVDLVPDGPWIDAVTVERDRAVSVAWTGTGALTAVEPVMHWEGAEVALPAVAPGTHPIAFPLPDAVPDGATVALRGIAGVASGPLGDAAALLTVAPTGLNVAYDGATVTATWDAASPPVDRYVAALAVPGQDVVATVVRDATASFPYAPETPPATAPTVTVAAMAGAVARGAFCAPVDVVTETPRVTLAAYDGATLRLEWTGDAARQYRVDVESGGVAAATYDAGGTAAAIPLVAGAWTVAVRAVGLRTTGRAGTVTPVTGAAEVTAVAFDAVGGVCHVAWQAVDGATAYALTLLDGAQPVATRTVPEKVTTLAASLFRTGGTYALSVQPVAATDDLLLTGPTAAVALPATPPTGVAVTYDGATVAAAWSGGARGYRVSTVSGGTATTLGDTSAPRGEWPLPAAPDGTALVVQPLDGAWAGAPSAPVPLYAESLFLGATWLAPATAPAMTATDVALALPDLFAGTPDLSKLSGLTPDLGLTLASGGAGGYVLTIPATSLVWTFGSGRVDVVAGWRAYVIALQGTDVSATPGGVRTITEAVSRALPQTFAESLYLAYGLQLARGCVDLRPGLVLRAEYEAYQSVPGTEQAMLSGYVATAVADYEVVYDAVGAVTGLDGFLSRLVAAGGVTVTAPSPPAPSPRLYGGGGVLDTFGTAMRAPFVRLVYPRSFPATNAAGSSFPQQNVVLLAAATLAALETGTDNVRNGVPPGGAVAAAYLRGRAVLRPMLRVTVDGTPRLVPAGTTLADVLAAAGRQPAVALPLTGVALRRARAAAVPTGSTAPPPDWPVRVDWSPGAATWLGLPLLHGDRLDLGDAR